MSVELYVIGSQPKYGNLVFSWQKVDGVFFVGDRHIVEQYSPFITSSPAVVPIYSSVGLQNLFSYLEF